VIAVDTNLLVYAHREDAKFHGEASATLVKLAGGTERWAVPWPCAHEFIAIVTHPKIYKAPTPLELALQALAELNACPTLEFIGEADGYLDSLAGIALGARVQGGAIHDARIAAICRFHGVRELWSADRDFSRFAAVKVRNPLLG
jgi:toxin-antitoxin system PIN domain toxin